MMAEKYGKKEISPRMAQLVIRRPGYLYFTAYFDWKSDPNQKPVGMVLSNRKNRVVVTTLKPGCAAIEKLQLFDRVLAVDDQPVSDKEKAKQLILRSGGNFNLTIERPLSEEACREFHDEVISEGNQSAAEGNKNDGSPKLISTSPKVEALLRRRPGYVYFMVTFDWKSSPGKSFGMVVSARNGQVIVTKLQPGGMAIEKLKLLDRCIAVNDQPVSDIHMTKQLISKSVGKFNLIIERPLTDETREEVQNEVVSTEADEGATIDHQRAAGANKAGSSSSPQVTILRRRPGYEYLMVNFDWKSNPGKSFGMIVSDRNGQVIVKNLKPGGMAIEKLKLLDRCIAVNDQPVTDIHMTKQSILKSVGKFNLIIERPLTDETRKEVQKEIVSKDADEGASIDHQHAAGGNGAGRSSSPHVEAILRRRPGYEYLTVNFDWESNRQKPIGLTLSNHNDCVIVSALKPGGMAIEKLQLFDRCLAVNNQPVSEKDMARHLILQSGGKFHLTIERPITEEAMKEFQEEDAQKVEDETPNENQPAAEDNETDNNISSRMEELIRRRPGYDYFTVNFDWESNNEKSIGFTLSNRKQRVIVTTLKPGGLAIEQLQLLDRVLAVDDQPVTDKEKARQLILRSGGKFNLTIERPLTEEAMKDFQEEVVQKVEEGTADENQTAAEDNETDNNISTRMEELIRRRPGYDYFTVYFDWESNPEKPIGFTLSNRKQRVIVTTLKPGGLAIEQLQLLDRVLAVDDHLVSDKEKARLLIIRSGGKFNMTIERPLTDQAMKDFLEQSVEEEITDENQYAEGGNKTDVSPQMEALLSRGKGYEYFTVNFDWELNRERPLGLTLRNHKRRVIVAVLKPGGIASDELKPFDRILAVNDQPVSDTVAAQYLIMHSGGKFNVTIERPLTNEARKAFLG